MGYTNKLIFYDVVNPKQYIFHKYNEIYTPVYTYYHKKYEEFYTRVLQDIENAKKTMEYIIRIDTTNHPNWFDVLGIV